TLIDAANSDLPDVRCLYCRNASGHLDEVFGSVAAQAGNRHAVNVAAGREHVGVEIGMCIQPQHTELPAPLAAVSSGRTDGTDAEAMVAAQQYGHTGTDEFLVHR